MSQNVTDGDPEYQEVLDALVQFDELGLWHDAVLARLVPSRVSDEPATTDKTSEVLASISSQENLSLKGRVSHCYLFRGCKIDTADILA